MSSTAKKATCSGCEWICSWIARATSGPGPPSRRRVGGGVRHRGRDQEGNSEDVARQSGGGAAEREARGRDAAQAERGETVGAPARDEADEQRHEEERGARHRGLLGNSPSTTSSSTSCSSGQLPWARTTATCTATTWEGAACDHREEVRPPERGRAGRGRHAAPDDRLAQWDEEQAEDRGASGHPEGAAGFSRASRARPRAPPPRPGARRAAPQGRVASIDPDQALGPASSMALLRRGGVGVELLRDTAREEGVAARGAGVMAAAMRRVRSPAIAVFKHPLGAELHAQRHVGGRPDACVDDDECVHQLHQDADRVRVRDPLPRADQRARRHDRRRAQLGEADSIRGSSEQ